MVEYVAKLSKIKASYGEYMDRKNGKGITAETILRSGAAWHHFQGLQNASRLLARLGSKGQRLGTGTTRNEQLHMELKAWGRNIYQTHIGRLRCSFRIFEMVKLLTHSSASYYPTLTQTRQRRLLFSIAGRIRKEGFFPSGMNHLEGNSLHTNFKRDYLHTAVVGSDSSTAMLRKLERKHNRVMLRKDNRKRRMPDENTTDVFKRRRVNSGF